MIAFNYCTKIYNIKKEIKDTYGNDKDFYEKRYKIRLEKTAPLLYEFEEYVNKKIKDLLTKSALKKALDYAKKLLPDMKTILEDGSLEIDNNASERAIKPFAIGRKNWLFSNTSKGAKASDLIYSTIEAAKANNLIVEKYLIYIFDVLAKNPTTINEVIVYPMLCSAALPEEVKISLFKEN